MEAQYPKGFRGRMRPGPIAFYETKEGGRGKEEAILGLCLILKMRGYRERGDRLGVKPYNSIELSCRTLLGSEGNKAFQGDFGLFFFLQQGFLPSIGDVIVRPLG